MSGAERARVAVAYIRSTVATETPHAQRSAIEAWAARERVVIRSWQLDLGVSSTAPIAERPGLVAAYAAIREQGAGVLVAANAERFSRDELVAWLIERAALTEGATIETADDANLRARGLEGLEGLEGSEAWTRGALDLARAYQRVVIRSRTRAALAEKRSRGERIGALPYGFRLAADGVHLQPDDGEQAVLRRVQQLSREGLSQRAIVAHLEARGVAGRTGAPLQQTQVARMLRSAS